MDYSSVATLGLVGLLAIPGVYSILSQVRSRTPKNNFYSDADGTSTPEAVAAFSNRRPKSAIVALSALGLATSIIVSVLSSVGIHQDGSLVEDWLVTATWAIILIQATAIAAHHSSLQSQNLGLLLMFSSLGTLVLVTSHIFKVGPQVSIKRDPGLSFRIANLLIAAFLSISSVLLPRRPDVFYKGCKVDAQWTVSVLARYTWSWAIPTLKLAKKKGDLDEGDVPQPDHSMRAELLLSAWHKFDFKSKLIGSILRAYGSRIILQWAVAFVRCVVGLGPFSAMLRLIQMLESRPPGESTPPGAWPLVIALAVCTLAEQWLDCWLIWDADTKMQIPIRGQLSALVFEKSLKRKNVKSADNSEKEDESDGAKGAANIDPADGKTKGDEKEDNNGDSDQSSVLKSRQAVVNLVGVDAKRIAEFSMWQSYVFACLVKLILYSVFLIKLIGWLPALAGAIAWALVIPMNVIATKLYMKYEDKLMKIRDEKLAVANETLLGIRQIKFSGLERQWEKRLMAKRDEELGMQSKIFLIDLISIGSWVFSPILLAAASLSTYAALHGGMSPSIAFVSIGIFKSLEVSLSVLPEVFGMVIDCVISARRINTYLEGPEMHNILSEGPEVSFTNATIAWPSYSEDQISKNGRFTLDKVNLTFPSQELSVIVGKTGTGKSLLLSALLGEADLIEGSIQVPAAPSPLTRTTDIPHIGNWILPGSVAYVAQTPWLESSSLRDNILFGLPYIESRYETVLNVCALKQDLQVLPDGDKTELGANGINLSGGQKWRVTLARAIYSRAGILILDDIFSAVDAHVGRHIFEKCLGGEICKGRTRILVTHHVSLVQVEAKFVVELGDGGVLHYGSPAELQKAGVLDELESHKTVEFPTTHETGGDIRESTGQSAQADNDVSLHKTVSKDAKKFVEEETRERGSIKGHVYSTYMKASGGTIFWIVCALLYVIFEASNIGRSWWIRIWTGHSQEAGQSTTTAYQQHGFSHTFSLQNSVQHSFHNHSVSASAEHEVWYYLWVYVAIATFSGLTGTLRFAWAFVMSLKASRTIFRRILFTVIRTPLRWLDTVPVGRILNRLTADFEIIDSRITFNIAMMFGRGLGLLGIFVAAVLVSLYILPLACCLVLTASFIGVTYLRAARPIKRLDSNSKSPVFELFNASLSGISTLRAYKKTQVYSDRMHTLLDTWNVRTYWLLILNRWMGFLMALLGTVFVVVTGSIVVSVPSITAAMAGFTLSFALDFSLNMLLVIRAYSSLELDMNAAERIVEYTELETESLGGEKPAASWPTSGKIDVEDLTVSYAPDLPAVLKNVSFSVSGNERIGVIGRTGAGKSSLTLALFRFLEARSGTITIDGVDISRMDLHSLRSRLAIIPQDPVLFSGSIRSNLDPFDDHTDESLHDCLSRVHLTGSEPTTPVDEQSSSAASTIVPCNNIFKDLSSGISESGGNLSQGQRQLLCIARAIIARPKIMVLDEATSSVDMATDALIQRSIREEFTDSTLVVIAHRLSTVADFDRILVLNEGSVAEFGTPKELWNKEGGMFRDMCEHSGERSALRRTILGA